MDSANKSEKGDIEAASAEDDGDETDDLEEWKLLEPLCASLDAPSHRLGSEGSHIERDPTSPHLSDGGNRELIHRWQQVASWCVKHETDPWKDLDFKNLPVRNCKRHRYSAELQEWTVDNAQIKLYPEPFAEGAMRLCFRLKKLSSHSRNADWTRAQNFVAKKYKSKIDTQSVFEDVKLQMDSKLWAEEFNRHNPPKKIDIFQVSVLEFPDEEEEDRFYHLERFIEGDYIKYNSNSGFVSDVCRKTPQAFSHFTFERSSHQLIVVDIQGVGDLYTDPQIHTANGHGYGSGNLGTKGIGLFFKSHLCNDICRSMQLTEFDLAWSEKIALGADKNPEKIWTSSTKRSRNRPPSICSSLVEAKGDAMEQLRRRTVSVNSLRRRSSETSSLYGGCSNDMQRSEPHLFLGDWMGQSSQAVDKVEVKRRHTSSCSSNLSSVDDVTKGRVPQNYQFESTSSCSSPVTRDEEKEEFRLGKQKESRPAGLPRGPEVKQPCDFGQHYHGSNLILGEIHLEIARYHQLGRFVKNKASVFTEKLNSSLYTDEDKVNHRSYANYDHDAAFYHLNIARRCGVLEAIVTMAKMALGLPHELLNEVNCKEHWDIDDLETAGFELMENAAHMGDQFAVVFLAEVYETGRLMRGPSWRKAITWYEKALELSDNSDEVSHEMLPRYELLERMANMYCEGGHGLLQDLSKAFDLYTKAAELATEAMLGKLANKYYELAELCAEK